MYAQAGHRNSYPMWILLVRGKERAIHHSKVSHQPRSFLGRGLRTESSEAFQRNPHALCFLGDPRVRSELPRGRLTSEDKIYPSLCLPCHAFM